MNVRSAVADIGTGEGLGEKRERKPGQGGRSVRGREGQKEKWPKSHGGRGLTLEPTRRNLQINLKLLVILFLTGPVHEDLFYNHCTPIKTNLTVAAYLLIIPQTP